MERRPTYQVYNEIITYRAIFLNLEEYRSHENEREADRARGQGARPPPWAPTLPQWPIRASLTDRAPPPLIFKNNHAIYVGLIRRLKFILGGYISKASPPQGRRRNHYQRKPSKIWFMNFPPTENQNCLLPIPSSSIGLIRQNQRSKAQRSGFRIFINKDWYYFISFSTALF